MLLLHFRVIFPSRFHCVFYIVCVVLVCSYIFFDVLDLDGSNFPRLLTPVARAVIVAETLVVIEIQDTRPPRLLFRNTGTKNFNLDTSVSKTLEAI